MALDAEVFRQGEGIIDGMTSRVGTGKKHTVHVLGAERVDSHDRRHRRVDAARKTDDDLREADALRVCRERVDACLIFVPSFHRASLRNNPRDATKYASPLFQARCNLIGRAPPSTRKATGGGPARSSAAHRGPFEHGAPAAAVISQVELRPQPCRLVTRRLNYCLNLAGCPLAGRITPYGCAQRASLSTPPGLRPSSRREGR